MKIIEARKADWKRRDRHHQAPDLVGVDESLHVIDADTGEVIAFQVQIPATYDALRRQLVRHLRYSVKFQGGDAKSKAEPRLSGMVYKSRTFGFTAPQPLRRRYGISAASFNNEEPDTYKMLEEITKVCWETFMAEAPEAATRHLSLVEGQIHDDWLIGGAPFTSGIINNTAALPYHQDSGNIKGTWNNMLCLRSHVTGGGLHLPEYGLTLGIPDGSISGFDGQGAWHGVTPFVKHRPDAYRFTLVWYTKQRMLGSGSAAEEFAKAKVRATKSQNDSAD